MRRLLYRLAGIFCDGCGSIIWPWQDRCFAFHSNCKHKRDEEGAARYGIPRWACARCGK